MIYTDGLLEINFVNGAVRIDLGGMTGRRDADGKPEMEKVEQVVMPPAAFVNAVNLMLQMMDHFEKAGIVGRNAPAPGNGAAPAEPINASATQSPNFPTQ